jgi:hypothetical protein
MTPVTETRREKFERRSAMLNKGGKMPVNDIDLEQSADVLWVPLDGQPPTGLIGSGERKHFSRLRDAIVFTMETLPLGDRATAWISLSAGSLKIEGIEALHRRLKPRESD